MPGLNKATWSVHAVAKHRLNKTLVNYVYQLSSNNLIFAVIDTDMMLTLHVNYG